MNKLENLHIDLNNICELNHFVFTYSRKQNTVGVGYSTLCFHNEEPDAADDPWQYHINKYGYRGNNWSFNTDAIAFFGCSFTFGIGVEKDIATLSQELLNTECYNIGQPGASAINVLKTFNSFIKYYPVKTAIITLPAFTRIYYPAFNDTTSHWEYGNLLPNWINSEHKTIHTHAFQFFNADTSLAYLYDYIQLAELSAKLYGTKIIWSSWDTDTQKFLNSVVETKRTINVGDSRLDIARDQLHPGPRFVQGWSSHIENEIRKYL